MQRALRPDGVLIRNDFLYPNRTEDFRNPEYALGVFDQALEVAWGSRHLSQHQLQSLFLENRFDRCEFVTVHLAFPALVRPGSAASYLSAPAVK